MKCLTELRVKCSTSAFLISGSRWRFTNMYHKESPARGRTYKASSLRLDFFSRRTERAESPPAIQYTSLWSLDAIFLCKHITPCHQSIIIREKHWHALHKDRRLHKVRHLKNSNKCRQECRWANSTSHSQPTGTSRWIHELNICKSQMVRKLCNFC